MCIKNLLYQKPGPLIHVRYSLSFILNCIFSILISQPPQPQHAHQVTSWTRWHLHVSDWQVQVITGMMPKLDVRHKEKNLLCSLRKNLLIGSETMSKTELLQVSLYQHAMRFSVPREAKPRGREGGPLIWNKFDKGWQDRLICVHA